MSRPFPDGTHVADFEFCPRLLCSVVSISAGIGLSGLVGAVAGSAIVGAVIGGGVSALTGGNVLTGALLGGAGGGISGYFSGAEGLTGGLSGGEGALGGEAMTLNGSTIVGGSGYLPGMSSASALSLGGPSSGFTAVNLAGGGNLDLPNSFINGGAAVFDPQGYFLGLNANSAEGKAITAGLKFNPTNGQFWTGDNFTSAGDAWQKASSAAVHNEAGETVFDSNGQIFASPQETAASWGTPTNEQILANSQGYVGEPATVVGGSGGVVGGESTVGAAGAQSNGLAGATTPLNGSSVAGGNGGVAGGATTTGAAGYTAGGGVVGGSGGVPGGTPTTGISTGEAASVVGAGGALSSVLGTGAGGLGMLPTLASAGGNVISALLGSNAAQNAAEIQANAANNAANAQLNMYNTTRGDLAPYNALGLAAVPKLAELTGTNAGGNPLTAALTKPFTGAELENTPGYQFTKEQGLRGVVNANSAQGLAGGGGALSTAMDKYNTGLASTTYNDQLKNYLAQNQQIFNMLAGIVQGGQNAAAQTGTFGIQSQTAANNLLTGGANAQAAGVVGSANAFGNAANNIGNLALTNALLSSMYNNGNNTAGG